MADEDRIRWDAIYRNMANQPYPPPDPLIYEYTPPVPDGARHMALDLAAGLGQNGLWLATQGYVVDIMDISRVALIRARQEMAMRNLRNVNLLPVDLDDADLGRFYYDLVCVFRYLKRDALPVVRNAIKPGGRIIYETYNLEYLRRVPEFNPRFLVEPGELAANFQGWEILLDDEDEYISRLVAVRPHFQGGGVTQPIPALQPDDDGKFSW